MDIKQNVTVKWGREFFEILQKITPPSVRHKKTTLILLADAVVAGKPFAAVFKPSPSRRACAAQTHYQKWMNDTAYRAAFDALIGTADAPGLARRRREEMLDEEAARALAQIGEAHRKLQLLALPAVEAMERGLTAETRIYYKDIEVATVPDTASQLRAARDIADRIPQLARSQKTDLTVTADPLTITPAGLQAAQEKARAELEELRMLSKNGV